MKSLLKIGCMAVAITFMGGSSALAGFNEFGKGPRSIAMGQAMVAAANDPSAATYNPAALVQARDYWGLGKLKPLIQITGAGLYNDLKINGVDQQDQYTPSIDIAMVMPITKRIVIGGGFFMTTDKVLTTELFFGPEISRWRTDHTFGLGQTIGIQVTKRFYIGYAGIANLAFNASTLNLDIGSLVNGIMGAEVLPASTNINPAFELDIISHNSYLFGALYRPFDWISLGFVYRYRNPSPVNIPVRVTSGGLMEDIDLTVQTYGVDPTYIAGGVALYPIEGLTLAFDLSYHMYSLDSDKAGMRVVSNNPDFSSDYPNVDLEDVWVPKFGVEWRDNFRGKFERVDYAVRAGYQYYPTPYPPAGTSKNMSTTLDNDAHYYTGGLHLGYKPYTSGLKKGPAYIAIEYFYEYIHLVTRKHRNIQNNPPLLVSEGNVVYNGFALTLHY